MVERASDRLAETYWELQTDDEPVGLEEFTQRAVAGVYGPVTGEDLCEFLRAVEERLVRQMEGQETNLHDDAVREDRIDETRGWIDDLIAKYCEG